MRALLAVLVLLAAAPAAQARSFSIAAPDIIPSDSMHTSTIGLAGDQVVWVERRGAAAVLVAATADGTRRELLTLPSAPSRSTRAHTLTASGGVALVQRYVCRSASCERLVADESVRVEVATGVATPFDPCPGEFGLSNYVLRASLLTCQGGVLVDLADGSSHQLGNRLAAAAGRYAVIVGPNDLRVVDWRTGERIRRVRGVHLFTLSDQVALGEDGTIAWAGERGVEVLRPGARRTRRAGPLGGFITQPRIVGGSLVVRQIEEDGGDRLRVSALDGSGVRSVAAQAPQSYDPRRDEFGWALDGSRVAWVARPCALPTIQVWDLAEAPPAPASEACGRSSLPDGTLRFGARRTRVPVAVSCPATPAEGCAGELSARFRARGREVGAGYLTAFAVPAGTTRTVAMRVVSPRRLRGRSGVTAIVDVTEGTFNATRRFRMQG